MGGGLQQGYVGAILEQEESGAEGGRVVTCSSLVLAHLGKAIVILLRSTWYGS